jgi:glycosyltransferase 2 family protein
MPGIDGHADPRLYRIARVVVAIALTAIVLWKSDVNAVVDAARGTRAAPLLAAVGFVIVDRSIMGWRWIALLGAINEAHRPPLFAALRIFFVSTFLGTFLPASIGGDAVRAVATKRLGVPAAPAAASVLLDRLLGVIGILALAVLGLFLARDLTTHPAIIAALAFTAAIAAAGAGLIFSDRAGAIARFAARAAPGGRLQRLGAELITALQVHRNHHRLLAAVLVASIAVQALRVLEAWMLGIALGIQTGFSTYLAFVPLILVIMLLPITISGIGTSQAAFVWLFGIAGVPASSAFALSVLFLGLGVVGNLPGAILYAGGSRRAERRT